MPNLPIHLKAEAIRSLPSSTNRIKDFLESQSRHAKEHAEQGRRERASWTADAGQTERITPRQQIVTTSAFDTPIIKPRAPAPDPAESRLTAHRQRRPSGNAVARKIERQDVHRAEASGMAGPGKEEGEKKREVVMEPAKRPADISAHASRPVSKAKRRKTPTSSEGDHAERARTTFFFLKYPLTFSRKASLTDGNASVPDRLSSTHRELALQAHQSTRRTIAAAASVLITKGITLRRLPPRRRRVRRRRSRRKCPPDSPSCTGFRQRR
jgi:hypothetical protein